MNRERIEGSWTAHKRKARRQRGKLGDGLVSRAQATYRTSKHVGQWQLGWQSRQLRHVLFMMLRRKK